MIRDEFVSMLDTLIGNGIIAEKVDIHEAVLAEYDRMTAVNAQLLAALGIARDAIDGHNITRPSHSGLDMAKRIIEAAIRAAEPPPPPGGDVQDGD